MSASPPPSTPKLPPPPPDEKIIVVEHRIRRLNWSLVSEAALGVVNLERGFYFTLRGFVIEPRVAFERYLGEDRLRFINPIKLVFFLTALTTFLTYQFDAFQALHSGEGLSEAAVWQGAFLQRNYNVLMLTSLPIMAGLGRLFYWGRAYNLLEHLALNAFQLSVTTAAYVLMLPAIIMWPATVGLYGVLALVYQIWIYRRVLGPGWFRAICATLTITAVYIVSVSFVAKIAYRLL